jgi:ferredoxin
VALNLEWFSTTTVGPATDRGYDDPPPRMGFFTDTSICIGCKACEVACKEWNHVPEDGLLLTGMSYDNTKTLSADSWRHVAFIEQHRPLAGQGVGDSPTDELRWLMSSDVQALHPRRLPRRVSDRFVVSHRVWHRRGPTGHLQRVRLLHPGLPLRRDRPAPRGWTSMEVHAVLRPAICGDDPGVRPGVPDAIDPVRAAGRVAVPSTAAGRHPA